MKSRRTGPVVAVDVFCGAGGLSYGLKKAGIRIAAGIDFDPECRYAFETNLGATFLERDVSSVSAAEVARLFPKKAIRLLAGCAPCRPYSPFRRGAANWRHRDWGLLEQFARLVRGVCPELVTMENVPGIANRLVFKQFVSQLEKMKYQVAWRVVQCASFGIPQRRKRLVLVASRLGSIALPNGSFSEDDYRTVRQAIARLPRVAGGETGPNDRLHQTRALSGINLKRIRASVPGGTWRDWPRSLRAKCHRRATGASYQSVYARMAWDEPSPTITTQVDNFGTGRFGHPEQDRGITLREAAILQSFPRHYKFVPPRKPVRLVHVARLVGNAVPPRLAWAIGRSLVASVQSARGKR